LRRAVGLQAEKVSFTVQGELTEDERHARDVMRLDAMIADLEEAIARDPRRARYHLRLAARLVARYDLALRDAPNEMPIGQLRDAAAAAGFADAGELHAWIERAVGHEAKSYLDRALKHVRLAHRQTPLEPEGYLLLADLAFLEGRSPEAAAAYLQQARHVDPHDGDVLIRAGADAFFQHGLEAATRLWREAFAIGPEYQRRMVLLMAGRVQVDFFLNEFQPDLELLDLMEYRYSQMDLPQELDAVRRYAAAKTLAAARQAERTSPTGAGELWLKAAGWYRKLEQHRAAALCGKRAVAHRPQDYQTRYAVARALADAGEYAEAEKHFRWCLDHHPDNAQLRQELQAAMAGRIRAASAETAGIGNPQPAR
jgi:tetratricopeptide (TPR) repeat protein